jgi:hypothetical protein
MNERERKYVAGIISTVFDDLHDRQKHDRLTDELWLAIYDGIAREANRNARPYREKGTA